MLNRDSAGLKEWFPNFVTFVKRNSFVALKQNGYAVLNVLFTREPPTRSEIPTINIYVRNNSFEELDHKNFLYQLGHTRAKFLIKGTFMLPNDGSLPVSIRLRGISSWHHQIWKPSLRIRFKKSGLANGYRNHILIAPEDGIGMRNWLSTELSEKWGLLNYDEHFIRLFINKKFMGVYTRYWRLDESIFVNQKKVFGPFFRLELTSKREFFRSKQNWYVPSGWDVIGISREEGIGLLSQPLNLAQRIVLDRDYFGNDQKRVKQTTLLNEYIDRESFAKYLALLCHAGGGHVDNIHNNAFWLDTPSGKLIPLLIDINGYGMSMSETITHPPILKTQGAFIRAWLNDPRNLSLYIEKLSGLIKTFGSAKQIDDLLQKKWDEIRPDLAADINISAMGSPKTLLPVTRLDDNFDHLKRFVHARIKWIKSQLSIDKVSVVSSQTNAFEVFIEGLAGFEVIRKDGQPFYLIGSKKENTRHLLLPSIPQKTRKKDQLVSKNSNLLPPGIKMVSIKIPESYAFYKLPGKQDDYIFSHRLTNQEMNFSPPPKFLMNLRGLAGISPLVFLKENTASVVIGPGKVVIKDTREYGSEQRVTIRAGSEMFLGTGVSLVFKGPLTVEGTNALPVTVRPLDPDKPFGVVALLGKGTKGSRIRHLDMEGGSVHRRYNLQFTGMFSVHDSPDVEISDSRFGKNFIGDDAVHIVRSKAVIKNSVFEDAYADALDWDLVDGEILNSRFINSGNDGADLSMGDVKIIGSYFEGAGDKCISAGEGTDVSVGDSIFKNCATGIAVKDSSGLTLNKGTFIGNGIAWNSYKKKWRWQTGGTGKIRNSQFIDSIEADIAGDKFSRVGFEGGIPDNLKIKGKISVTTSGS